jgi:hypothetical protein
LYKTQGRPDLSLAILLNLQLPSVFDFLQVRHVFMGSGSRGGQLRGSWDAVA